MEIISFMGILGTALGLLPLFILHKISEKTKNSFVIPFIVFPLGLVGIQEILILIKITGTPMLLWKMWLPGIVLFAGFNLLIFGTIIAAGLFSLLGCFIGYVMQNENRKGLTIDRKSSLS